MKKKFILALAIFFSLIGITNAQEDIFIFDWETEERDTFEYTYEYLLVTNKAGLSDGYVTSYVDIDGNTGPYSLMTVYNSKGEEVKTKKYREELIYDMITVQDTIYALSCPIISPGYMEIQYCDIYKMDKNLKRLDTYEMPMFDRTLEQLFHYNKLYGMHIFTADEAGNIYFYYQGAGIIINDEYPNGALIENVANSEREYNKMMESLTIADFIRMESEQEFAYTGGDYNGEKYVFSGIYYCDARDMIFNYDTAEEDSETPDAGLQSCRRPIASLEIYDDLDNRPIVYEEYDEYTGFENPTFIKDYIVTIGYKFDDEENEGMYEIVVFDMEGNIVQTIPVDDAEKDETIMLKANDNSFMITKVEEYDCPVEYSNSNNVRTSISDYVSTDAKEEMSYCATTKEQVYYLPLNITTKVEGKGSIEVIENSRYGDTVTFKVTPEAGYKLDKVIVTDKQGNEVTFTEYTFTMPDADVKIEAIFVVDNPNTSSIALAAITTVAFIVLGIYFYCSKKIVWLK